MRHIAQAGENLDRHRSVPNAAADFTAMDWEVHLYSFYQLLHRLYFAYKILNLLVTENDGSYPDGLDANGRTHDQRRIDYLHAHMTAVHRAIQNSVPISGYLQWSLLDNYGWTEGYTQRFGMIYVNYETQQRLPEARAYWFRDVIAQNDLDVGAIQEEKQ